MDLKLWIPRSVRDYDFSDAHVTAILSGSPSEFACSTTLCSRHPALVFNQKIIAAVFPAFACWNNV
jgi:hypothetical protein